MSLLNSYCFFLLSLFLYFPTLNSRNSSIAHEFQRALQYIDNIQHDCSHKKFAYIEIGCEKGCGGGFASQFQLAAMKWMRTFSWYKYQIPVIIRGHLKEYSDVTECAQLVNNSWTCYFQPTSLCEDRWLQEAEIVPTGMNILDNVVPPEFEHMGVPWWWGVVQHRLFRLQENVKKAIHARGSRMNNGRGFPSEATVIGVHVRHGDKSSDGWTLQSLDEELVMARLSPDCQLPDPNLSQDAGHLNGVRNRVCTGSAGTDEKTAKVSESTSKDNLNENSGRSRGVNEEADFSVYVASDDPAVLTGARDLGFLVDEFGVSQQTGTEGMEKFLETHPSARYNATLEIIQDIHFLSKCSTLVGMAASQIFRMAVGMSQATGVLRYAVAADFPALPNIIRMSWWLRLIVPEPFHSPDGTEINVF